MAKNKAELIKKVEQDSIRTDLDKFEVGDTVEVHVRLKEGDKERVQVFTGTVIAISGGGASRTFTVRRLTGNEGVERIFPVHSPSIVKVKVRKHGKIRRAKLHYLRGRTGRKAVLTERRVYRKPAPEPAAPSGDDTPSKDA